MVTRAGVQAPVNLSISARYALIWRVPTEILPVSRRPGARTRGEMGHHLATESPRFQDCSFHGIGRLFAFADDLGVNEHECQIGRFVGPIAPGMIGAALDQYVAGLE
jgi:hypothetical protein